MNQTNNAAIARQQYVERLLQSASLRQAIYHHADAIKVYWPDDLTLSGEITVRLQTPMGRIYAESHPTVQAGSVVNLGSVYQAPDGEYQVMLLPNLEEYYVHGLRIERPLAIQISNVPYAVTPYGTYPERRLEALTDAIRRNNLFSEIAKLELGRSELVDWSVINACLTVIQQGGQEGLVALVGLLGLVARYQDEASFPETLTTVLTDCMLNFNYQSGEIQKASESQQILCFTAASLAGQLFPDAVFAQSGQNGAVQQAAGEALALAWLRQRATGGFRAWDSPGIFAEIIVALTHLVDLAENSEVAEMAAVLLDKLFFTLALNSYQGVFGATQARGEPWSSKSGRLSPVAGIARLLWGVGAFNEQIAGTVSLACAHGYELPPIIAQIATDLPEELWNRERHAGDLEEALDGWTGGWAVNKVTYKTPDYLLGSAQDYQPGATGDQERIWAAIFGPDAIVFVNHPHEKSGSPADGWLGNGVLPRVAQWKDVLVALHQLPADDKVGFTHAYFPTTAFDEYLLRDGWAFARKGNGYLALTAACGLSLTTQGEYAYRELRSEGRQNVWFCQLGRAAQDGSFADFQTKVLGLAITFAGLTIQAKTLRQDTLAFGWNAPLVVNGQAQALQNDKHYNNPYCVADLPATQMELQFQDQLMRLDFSVLA
ncbi:MAG: hypothetical protein U0350_38545 [Caldilineaceae bacterium]